MQIGKQRNPSAVLMHQLVLPHAASLAQGLVHQPSHRPE